MVRTIGLIAAAVMGLGLAATGLAAWLVLSDNRLPAGPTDMIIADGSSVGDIAWELEAHGVVQSHLLLSTYVRLHGGGDRIQAAEYDFPAHQTVAAIAAVLFAGGRPPVAWVTIPEGYTAAQIGRRLENAGLASQQDFARTVRFRSLRIAGASTHGLEGYLFPDTYQIPRRATADDIATLLTQQFMRELPRDYLAAAARLRLRVPQIVIIASMIEREARVDVERPLIASVIYNRMARGMPLEIDATIEYALPHYKSELSFSDLAIDSPYNTYVHAGLPPGPISNPGRASLGAAFHPATTSYLYYVYKGNGRHAFAQTLDEQQTNERRYLH